MALFAAVLLAMPAEAAVTRKTPAKKNAEAAVTRKAPARKNAEAAVTRKTPARKNAEAAVSWRIPLKTKNAKTAVCQIGRRAHCISYGQTHYRQLSSSGCTYCAVASMLSLYHKDVHPLTIYNRNGRSVHMSFGEAIRIMRHYKVPAKVIPGSRIKEYLKAHKPVICTVSNMGDRRTMWASSHPGEHHILLLGFLPRGRVVVCDSARDRAWAGKMQRFKIVKWSSLAPYIMTWRDCLAATLRYY